MAAFFYRPPYVNANTQWWQRKWNKREKYEYMDMKYTGPQEEAN